MAEPASALFPVSSSSILLLDEQLAFQQTLHNNDPQETDSLLGISKRKFPRRVLALLIVCLFYITCCTSVLSAAIELQYKFICSHYSVDPEVCMHNQLVNQAVADLMGYNSMILSSLSLITGSVLSMSSDKVGRKPMMLYALLCSMLSYTAQFFIYFKLDKKHTIWVMCLPKIIDGLGGNPTFVAMLCIPYISDMIRDNTARTALISYVNGSIYASIGLGPALGSYIVRNHGLKSLYTCVIIGISICFLLMLVFIKESLSPYKRRRNSDSQTPILKNLSILKFPFVKSKVSRLNVYTLFFSSVFGQDFAMAFGPVLMVYSKFRFGWSAVQQGYLLTGISATRTSWLLLGFPLLYTLISKLITVHPERVDTVDMVFVRLALGFPIIAFLCMGYASTEKQFVLSVLLEACSSSGSSIFTSALIKHIPPDKFGAFTAATNGISSFIGIFLTPFILKVYSLAISWRPSLPFEVASLMIFVCFCCSFLVKPEKLSDI